MHPLFEQPQFTIGELGRAIFAIHDPIEAVGFFQDYRAWLLANATPSHATIAEADSVALANIGWFFGEGMPQADIDMWVAATGAQHPIFGNMSTPPTPEEAFKAGCDWIGAPDAGR